MVDSKRFVEESDYLSKTKKVIEQELENQIQTLERIPNEYKGRYSDVKWGDEDLVDDLTKKYVRKIKTLQNLSQKPYFGRFDFAQEGFSSNKYYIGKTDVIHNGTIYVLDWRNPICTLYYDQSLGKVSYTAPKGVIKGDLTLKSQILIENGLLDDVNDIDLVTQDELLQPYLNVHADKKMKNIIASIQAEQNEIIRKSIHENIIVQGVAGSGKTSVALHRIAYLLYNYSHLYKPSQYLIIGPNKYFLDYVSTILPDLDTNSVSEITFEELAAKIICNNKYTIENSNDELNSFLKEKKDYTKYKKLKGSLAYKESIDAFLHDYFNDSINSNISFENKVLFDNSFFKENLTFDKGYLSKNKKFVRIFINRIKENWENIYYSNITEVNEQIKLSSRHSVERQALIEKADAFKDTLKRGYDNEINKIVRPLNIEPIELYKLFIYNIDKYLNLSELEIQEFKNITLKKLKKKVIPYDDLAAISYMYILRDGNTDYKDIKQVVIDEAQDYNMFQYYIIKDIFNKSKFSIFGDLAQSIYSYRSINSWEELNNIIFDNGFTILSMTKSYRTTKQVTELSNKILHKLHLPEAIPVIRTGEDVTFEDISTNRDLFYRKEYQDYIDKKFTSMGIICKSVEEMNEVSKILDKQCIPYNLITSSDVSYKGGICLLTSFLAKGLEFDKVIISDASREKYHDNSIVDMKLLYVALTRALHEVDVVYDKELTKPLQVAAYKEENHVKQKVKTTDK